MSKDLKLDKPVDNHLKPIKDSDGNNTALEVSTEDVRIKNDLKINGDLIGVEVIKNEGNIDIECGNKLHIKEIGDSTQHLMFSMVSSANLLEIYEPDSYFDYLSVIVGANGATIISTIDAGGDDANLSIMADGDLKLDWAAGKSLIFQIDDTAVAKINAAGGFTFFILYEAEGAGSDSCFFAIAANGATTLYTVDAASDAADFTLDADGDITLDSHTGVFIAKKAGTEFSAANSAYAGMILGYTNVFHATTTGSYMAVTTSWVSLVWNTDKYALVTFVVPPSNKVEIKVHLPYCILIGNLFYLGLATDSSATTLNAKYENKAWDVDESDVVGINYSWVVDGSDHSWAAGETKTLYIMAYAGGTTRIYNGGTNSGYYGGATVQATALPATIGDGSEP